MNGTQHMHNTLVPYANKKLIERTNHIDYVLNMLLNQGLIESDSIIILSRPESEFPFEFQRPILIPVPASVSILDDVTMWCLLGHGCHMTHISVLETGVTGGVGEEEDNTDIAKLPYS